jgi:hypothetical protein
MTNNNKSKKNKKNNNDNYKNKNNNNSNNKIIITIITTITIIVTIMTIVVVAVIIIRITILINNHYKKEKRALLQTLAMEAKLIVLRPRAFCSLSSNIVLPWRNNIENDRKNNGEDHTNSHSIVFFPGATTHKKVERMVRVMLIAITRIKRKVKTNSNNNDDDDVVVVKLALIVSITTMPTCQRC